MKSTRAMRTRIRELMPTVLDDYDRAVQCLLDDFEQIERWLGSRGYSMSEHDERGFRLVIGFRTLRELSEAHMCISSLCRPVSALERSLVKRAKEQNITVEQLREQDKKWLASDTEDAGP